jgi:hypothetical protein
MTWAQRCLYLHGTPPSRRTVNIFGFLAVGISDDHAGMVMFSKAEKSAVRQRKSLLVKSVRIDQIQSAGFVGFRFCFIDQHLCRDIVDEIARGNSDHRHGFFFPHVYDTALDNFAGVYAETNGRA